MDKITHPEVHSTELYMIIGRLLLQKEPFTMKAEPLESAYYWKVEVEQ